MHRSPNSSIAAARARWLAELAHAIEEAQRLAWQLGVGESDSAEAKELYGRLDLLRAEVDALRRNGWTSTREEVDPPWKSPDAWATTFRESIR